MTLFDFECGSCGASFERMVEQATIELPCVDSACTGTAVRQLGGRPLHGPSSKGGEDVSDWPVGMARVKMGNHMERALMRPVMDTGDGVIVEVSGSDALVNSMHPGKKLHVSMHQHTGEACVTRTGVAQVLDEV